MWTHNMLAWATLLGGEDSLLLLVCFRSRTAFNVFVLRRLPKLYKHITPSPKSKRRRTTMLRTSSCKTLTASSRRAQVVRVCVVVASASSCFIGYVHLPTPDFAVPDPWLSCLESSEFRVAPKSHMTCFSSLLMPSTRRRVFGEPNLINFDRCRRVASTHRSDTLANFAQQII